MRRTPFGAAAGTDRTGWPTLVGLAVVPLVVTAVLGWGLWAPAQNLDRVTAAVVNDDQPVTQNGTTIPLGRQFAAALIQGGPTSTASTGGSSATEAPPADDPGDFTWVLTNDDDAASGLAGGTYAAVLTIPKSFSADATSIGGPAASAKQASVSVRTSPSAALVDPALTAAVSQAATASLGRQLTVTYLQNVYAGFNTIDQQIGSAASGAAGLASGAASLDTGTQQLAAGAASLADGAATLDAGAASLSSGLDALSTQTQSLPARTAQLAQGSAAVAGGVGQVAAGVSSATASFAQVTQQLCARPGPLCTRATAALTALQSADGRLGALSAGAGQVAAGNEQLAGAMPALVDGIDQAASGGADVASGAASVSSGAASLSSGAASAASGAAQVDSGAAQLSSGLASAVTSIPTYTDSDIATLSAVVAQPVVADQGTPAPGLASIPLFCVLALWLGGMTVALARRAVPTRHLLSAAPSAGLALRSAGLVAAIGAGQGIVVAGAAQFGLGLRPDVWIGFALAAAFAGAVFAVVNQALAAAFGGVGRVVAVAVGVLALVVGLSSTAPPALVSIASVLPTAPALGMLRSAAAGDAGGAWAGAGLLLVFGIAGLALTLAAVAARRNVGMRAGVVAPA